MSWQLTEKNVFLFKAILFVLAAIPFIGFAVRLALYLQGTNPDALGVNPAETLSHGTGNWALRFFLITLLITPLRRITGWVWLVRVRRLLGLYAFFYAMAHLGVYLVIDQMFNFMDILKDIAKRPYITVGVTALLLTVPLAITSTNGMVRRLGGRRWRMLHRLAYLIAFLGIVHFWWLVKFDYTEPLIYMVIWVILMLARIKRNPRPAS